MTTEAVDKNNSEKLTPMMRQYYELRQQCGDAVLFFRMGDFYELFGGDAQRVAPLLEIVLTSREKGENERIPFCGVPHHSAKNYWLKLLKMGLRVAIADQVEDPADAKGLVKRAITKMMTPGCVDELEALDAQSPNYLLAAYEVPQNKQWVIAVADVSTGELRAGGVKDFDAMAQVIETYRPREVLLRKFFWAQAEKQLQGYLQREKATLSVLPEGILRSKADQDVLLTTTLGDAALKVQPCGAIKDAEIIVAGILEYLRSMHFSLASFKRVLPLFDPECMRLSDIVVRDLELFETARRRDQVGSLFYEINETLSPMGARLLRRALSHPLFKAAAIAERQDVVSFLAEQQPEVLIELREVLKNCPDLERLTTRVITGHAQPYELLKIKQALDRIAKIRALFITRSLKVPALLNHTLEALSHCQQPLELLDQALSQEVVGLGADLKVFREGFDAKLDELRELSRHGQQTIDQYEDKERQKTGITSLKIKSHKTFGLTIEITRANLGKIPDYFVRRQTMVNCERFSTKELEALNQALMAATANAMQREAEMYAQLLTDMQRLTPALRQVEQGIAVLDLLQGFSWKARSAQYCRPILATDGTISLTGARHPVIESFVGRHRFVANDVAIAANKKTLLITGPNMAGKSTVMRQTALIAILHQIGSFVPAAQAYLPLFDQVFTRVGATDDLAQGQSTFMVEMAEAAIILRHATAQSLVILDEVGRGTSTQDGLAIASAILEEIACTIKPYCLFATHYHELIPFAQKLEQVRLVQTEVTEQEGHICFSHRLIDGAAGSSFGIEAARLAGIPTPVIQKAQGILAALSQNEGVTMNQVANQRQKRGASTLPLERLGLNFDRSEGNQGFPDVFKPIRGRLKTLDIHATTPLEALTILNEFKAIYEKSPWIE